MAYQTSVLTLVTKHIAWGLLQGVHETNMFGNLW